MRMPGGCSACACAAHRLLGTPAPTRAPPADTCPCCVHPLPHLAPTLLPAERITAALKSLPLQLCGYSGLMLPVCEDSGLAAAADEGRLSLQARCVCQPCMDKLCSGRQAFCGTPQPLCC